ncbi:MAG: hypothetical protein R3A78_16760 [Polyangiales bacterium]
MKTEATERVEHALSVLRDGGMVILVDDEDRENEVTSSWWPSM